MAVQDGWGTMNPLIDEINRPRRGGNLIVVVGWPKANSLYRLSAFQNILLHQFLQLNIVWSSDEEAK